MSGGPAEQVVDLGGVDLEELVQRYGDLRVEAATLAGAMALVDPAGDGAGGDDPYGQLVRQAVAVREAILARVRPAPVGVFPPVVSAVRAGKGMAALVVQVRDTGRPVTIVHEGMHTALVVPIGWRDGRDG